MASSMPPNGQNGSVSETARRDAADIGHTAHRDWQDAKDRAREDFDAVKREARSEFDHAREAAGEFAEGQKNHAADQIDGIASAFDRVGNDLRSNDNAWAGRYAGELAGRLQGVANRARTSSVDELVGDVERFGRERPAAFLAGAALLGLAASRFMTASANRRRARTERYYDSLETRPQAASVPAQPRAAEPAPIPDEFASTRDEGEKS